MIAWGFLTGAIAFEVLAAISLRMAVGSRRGWYALVAVGYACAFALLGLALARGMALSVAYGVWTAAGVALTAALGKR